MEATGGSYGQDGRWRQIMLAVAIVSGTVQAIAGTDDALANIIWLLDLVAS